MCTKNYDQMMHGSWDMGAWQMDGQMEGQTDSWTDGQTKDRWTDKCSDRGTDGWTDKKMTCWGGCPI